jgi:hypothetical protein
VAGKFGNADEWDRRGNAHRRRHAAPVPTAATIADADPQISGALRLATWAGLNLTAVDVGNLRLAMMVIPDLFNSRAKLVAS